MCKTSTEGTPCADLCKHGIQLYDATLTAIGWGVGCLANVDKAQLQKDRGTLINDMDAVYQQRRFDPKKLPKCQLQTLLSNKEPAKPTEWMTSQEWIAEGQRGRVKV